MRTHDSLPFVLAAVLPFQLYAQTPTVFHWKLDETEGAIAHAEHGGPSGTLQQGAVFAPLAGHHKGAVRFDGVDDRVILGPCDITTGGSGFSISLWVKPDFVTGAERTLIAKTVGPADADHIWSLAFVNGTGMRFRLRTGGATTVLSCPPSSIFGGAWYHIAATYDGATMKLHLNGSLMASVAATGLHGYHPQAPASLGARSTGQAPFSGWVDDVRIYDSALSTSEIIDILMESEVTTGMAVEAPRLSANGIMELPHGTWRNMTIVDAAGRMVASRALSDNGPVSMNAVPSGHYIVCLQSEDRRGAWPMFVP